MIKYLLFLIIILISLNGFAQKKVDVNQLTSYEKKWYVRSTMTLFSGIMTRTYTYRDSKNSNRFSTDYSESSIVDGVFNGESKKWKNDNLQSVETYLNGILIKEKNYFTSDGCKGNLIIYDKSGVYIDEKLDFICPNYYIKYDYQIPQPFPPWYLRWWIDYDDYKNKVINKQCYEIINNIDKPINCTEIPIP